MIARVYTCAVIGLEGVIVEVDNTTGFPGRTIVGFPDAAVQESRERGQAAVKNAGLGFPRKRIIVNLATASVHKEGPYYDLPIAFGMLVHIGALKPVDVEGTLVVGELSLDGAVRHVRGVQPMAAVARREGFKRLVVPEADAALIPDLEVIPVSSLAGLNRHLSGTQPINIIAFLVLGQLQGGISLPETSAWWAAGLMIVAIMFLLTGLAHRRRGALAAALFATAAGIGFGFQATVTKEFMGQLGCGLGVILTSWTTYALIISALAGFALLQSALKTGSLAPAMAASNAASLATGVFLGVILFQETISKGQGRLPPALFALALAIFGVILLAYPQNRRPEVVTK
jgi:hypothetical protein